MLRSANIGDVTIPVNEDQVGQYGLPYNCHIRAVPKGQDGRRIYGWMEEQILSSDCASARPIQFYYTLIIPFGP